MAEKNGDSTHRLNERKTGRRRTKTERKKIEGKLGSRYMSLLQLPYYGSITKCVIDPMHNLSLGMAKKMFKVWCENDIFIKKNLQEVEECREWMLHQT